jgi:hypothetical protein
MQMIPACVGIDDLYGLVSRGQTIPDEGEQHAILFIIVREKRANMANRSKLRAGKRNWSRSSFHI